VWHRISGKHMGRYLREVEFRLNHRGSFEGRLEKMFDGSARALPLTLTPRGECSARQIQAILPSFSPLIPQLQCER